MSFVDESQGLFVSRRKTGERWSRHCDSECFVREELASGRRVLVSLHYLFAYLGLFENMGFFFSVQETVSVNCVACRCLSQGAAFAFAR